MVIVKIIVFTACLLLGIFFLIKTERIVFTVGHNSWAERYLGSGGTYTMWKVIAILVIIFGALFLWGKFDFVFS